MLKCNFIPAAYAKTGPGPTDYGNYALADRPRDMKIRYIVIDPTPGDFTETIKRFQDPTVQVSTHYVIRARDGHVTQMVRTKNVAWEAGNWYTNMHAISIQHEGSATEGGFTEAQYRASAKLVRYLAKRFGIPLDRQHIIGHDNVPPPVPEDTAEMQFGPGPFWNWERYLMLLRAPIGKGPERDGGLVTINPRFATNRPVVTDCSGKKCVKLPRQGANFVYLHTAPSREAPLLSDPALHPDGSPGTTEVSDWGDKAVTGQTFAVYKRVGDWVGIWYAGEIGWFRDPARKPTAVSTCGLVVTPRRGQHSIPVYGRAFPEKPAYRGTGVYPQPLVPLQYLITTGQRYAMDPGRVPTDYYAAEFGSIGTVVTGRDRYRQIWFNHRQAFVRASDVTVTDTCRHRA